jgi:hypothetical protein
MENGLNMMGSFWGDIAQWRPHAHIIYAMLVTAVISTGFMSRVVGGIPYVVYSVGFVIMYLSAYFLNFVAKGYVIHGINEFQRGAVFSFCGQIFGAVILLVLFRVKDGFIRRV